MERMYLPRAVSRYISRLVAASHPGSPEATADVTTYVTYGASPRAAIAMAEASRAYALLAGRPSVGFEDVRAVAPAVMNHRLILNYKARFDQIGELADRPGPVGFARRGGPEAAGRRARSKKPERKCPHDKPQELSRVARVGRIA